jgi:hypothetical protein
MVEGQERLMGANTTLLNKKLSTLPKKKRTLANLYLFYLK